MPEVSLGSLVLGTICTLFGGDTISYWNLEFCDEKRQAGWPFPRIHLFLPPQCLGYKFVLPYLAFYLCSETPSQVPKLTWQAFHWWNFLLSPHCSSVTPKNAVVQRQQAEKTETVKRLLPG